AHYIRLGELYRPHVENGEKAGEIVVTWYTMRGKSKSQTFSVPAAAKVNDGAKDFGLRFIDLDGDGYDDLIFSNENGYGVYLFKDMKEGWSRKVIAGKEGDPDALPMIAKKGENMGYWVHSDHLWWSNETTVLLKDHVARRSFKELLQQAPPR